METESGAEYISPTHVRHIMRYVKACQFLKPDDVILDAACGTGYGTALIAKQNMVIGFDNNDDALKEAKKNYPHITFVNVDLLYRMGDLNINAVISIETIEHFAKEDIKLFLENVNYVLPMGGTFIVTTPYCRKSGPSPITKQHLHEFSLTDLEITLNDAGFAVQAIYPERHEGQAGRLGYCMAHCVAR